MRGSYNHNCVVIVTVDLLELLHVLAWLVVCYSLPVVNDNELMYIVQLAVPLLSQQQQQLMLIHTLHHLPQVT